MGLAGPVSWEVAPVPPPRARRQRREKAAGTRRSARGDLQRYAGTDVSAGGADLHFVAARIHGVAPGRLVVHAQVAFRNHGEAERARFARLQTLALERSEERRVGKGEG